MHFWHNHVHSRPLLCGRCPCSAHTRAQRERNRDAQRERDRERGGGRAVALTMSKCVPASGRGTMFAAHLSRARHRRPSYLSSLAIPASKPAPYLFRGIPRFAKQPFFPFSFDAVAIRREPRSCRVRLQRHDTRRNAGSGIPTRSRIREPVARIKSRLEGSRDSRGERRKQLASSTSDTYERYV